MAYVALAEIDPDSDDALRALLQGLKDSKPGGAVSMRSRTSEDPALVA